VAIDTTLRFLKATEVVETAWVDSRLKLKPPAQQRVVRVTEPVVARSMDFKFARPWKGLEVIEKAGSVVATDGDKTWRTPYDNCVLVMPSLVHLKPGTTMVRLGRYG
jgi:hypothetical protein